MTDQPCKHKWINATIQKTIIGFYWEICFNCGQTRKIKLRSKKKYEIQREEIRRKIKNE